MSWLSAAFIPFSHVFQFRGVGKILPVAPLWVMACSYVMGVFVLGLSLGIFSLDETHRLLGFPISHQRYSTITLELSVSVLVTCILAALLVLLGVVLMWIEAYRFGSVTRSIALTFKGVMAQLMFWSGIATLLMLVAQYVSYMRQDLRSWFGDSEFFLAFAFASIGAVSFWQIVAVTRRMLKEASDSDVPELPDRLCEGCGYNITHADAESVCPECGQAVATSILPGTRRGGISWEKSAELEHWVSAAVDCLFQPASFYRKLQLRTDDRAAGQFARVHLILIGLGAGIWMFTSYLLDSKFSRLPYAFVWMTLGMCIFPIIGWLVARIVSSLVGLAWHTRGLIRDGRWLAKVVRYESSYLWVFCAYNGLLVTSFFVDPKWIRHLVQAVFPVGHIAGIPPEPIVILGGNAILILLWMIRYRTILRAIQYSNY